MKLDDLEAPINRVIEFAMSDCLFIPRERRQEISDAFSPELLALLDQIRSDCDSPIEAWTGSKTLEEAVSRVEPGLRTKYPQLNDRSIQLLLNHAAFSWI